ncbi:unnamed protein product [Trypanosoma congolense IL3000]|uniref:nicotinamidase n=1 Tax=Trypanosoma congolense (strain IL3000) TaxID=1068625 RepID=F9WI33_TRYCI|nr:unnamed protein product [Trypanosoma congolense IL3000]
MSTPSIEISSQHDALLVVDMQNDFVKTDGRLSVAGAEKLLPTLNHIIKNLSFRAVVASKDWHPPNHISFRKEDGTGGQWPPHCVQSTPGAEFHRDLEQGGITHIVHKATSLDSESYSAFCDEAGVTTGLGAMLHAMGVKRIFVCGVAYDYCVYYTSLDARKENFSVVVLEDVVLAVDPENMGAKREHMEREGITFAESKSLFKIFPEAS